MTKRRGTPPGERRRRAFGPIGGEVRTRGEASAAAALAASWRAAVGEGRSLTHGVHAYPARMHPEQAHALVLAFSPAGGVVLDPFCGSGTVLVEAFARGRRAIGTDVHPLAVTLSRAKTRRVPAATRRAMEEAAQALARAGSRAGRDRHADVEAPDEALRWFAPHVLRELSALAGGIERVARAEVREALRLVLSSIVVKVSRQLSETDRRSAPADLPPGRTSTLFADRAVELGEALAALERVARAPGDAGPAARPTPEPLVLRADARVLPVRPRSVDLVLTSPPYLGTYDYARTQELRAAALGFDLADAERREIGARSRAGAKDAPDRYREAMATVLGEARRVLRPRGACVVVIGDSIAGDRTRNTTVAGDRTLEDAARAAGLEWVATASQDRPALPPAPAVPRREHVLLFRAPANASSTPA